MNKIQNLKPEDAKNVAGGAFDVTGGSIYDELLRRFPGGEWVGNIFYPNGRPQPMPSTSPVIY